MKYMFEHISSRDYERSRELQEVIARNVNPRSIIAASVLPGRQRGARFVISRPVSPPPSVAHPAPSPAPTPEAGTGESSPPPAVNIIPPTYYGGNVLQFHFFALTPGGGGNNEIRVSPPLDYPHIETKSLLIVPYGNVQAGQFIQVFVSSDDDVANTPTPTGANFSGVIGRLGTYPAPDNTRAIPVPPTTVFFDTFRVGWTGGGYIKLRLFFVSPATALPTLSIIIPIAYRYSDQPGLFAVRA